MASIKTNIAKIPRVFSYLHYIKVQYSYFKFDNSIKYFYSQACTPLQSEYDLEADHRSTYISSCLL